MYAKIRMFHRIGLVATGLVICTLACCAQEKLTLQGETEPDFVGIFNGKDLAGWDGAPGFWSVKDGCIIARVSPGVQVKNHSYLIWQGGKVEDFELRLLVRSTQGNSGIDYRAEQVLADRKGKQLRWTIRGYQSDIAKGWNGSLYNWGKPGAQPGQFVVVSNEGQYTGSVVDKEILYRVPYFKPGGWNEYTIIARGSHILHRINGYPVVEFIDNSRDARRQGLLGLQVHTGGGPFLNEFKDIRIKPFRLKFGQAKLLFNGKDSSGWTFSGVEARKAWSVENGTLVGKGSSQGYICTKDDYKNFILRFQYRRQGQAESGVLLCGADFKSQQPKYIRVYGKGDDFNHVQSTLENLKIKDRKSTFKNLPEGFWNECEIILNKRHLEVKVNNAVRVMVKDCEPRAGKIGFEAGGSRIEFRNMVLIPILTE